jgi:putative ABC transport system permease protein
MNTLQFLGALELGLLYGIVALGVYLSFRVLDFPDLTVDGSFPLGAAIAATLLTKGYSPVLATLAALGGGFTAGLVTAWLNVKWKLVHLLASILTMTALYSINLRIMGRSNIALVEEKTLFNTLNVNVSLILACIVALVMFLLWRFLRSEIGLAMRATGANPKMALAQGISTSYMISLGLGISNSLVALAGALFAQSQGFSDTTMGIGTIVIGLASVIMGEVFISRQKIFLALLACVIGSIVYRLMTALALNIKEFGLQPSDLNMVTAILVAFAMILPRLTRRPSS